MPLDRDGHETLKLMTENDRDFAFTSRDETNTRCGLDTWSRIIRDVKAGLNLVVIAVLKLIFHVH